MEEDNLYAVLQLKENGPQITNAIIQKAYHKCALKIHLIKSKENPLVATEEFQELNKAYDKNTF